MEFTTYENNYEVNKLGEIFKKTKKGKRPVKGSLTLQGYKVVSINGKKEFLHRVIYKAFNNEDINIIDHIDGNKLNNKLENLRNTDYIENSFNKPYRSLNKNMLQDSNIILDGGKYRVKIRKFNRIFDKRFKELDAAKAYKLEALHEIEKLLIEYREKIKNN